MFDENLVILCGNIAQLDELKYAGDVPVLNFSLATNRSRKIGKDEYENLASFHRVACFGKMAERLSREYEKGDKVYVSGRLEYSEYEKDGIKRYSTKIVADKSFGFKRKNSTNEGNYAPKTTSQAVTASDENEGIAIEDIPFTDEGQVDFKALNEMEKK